MLVVGELVGVGASEVAGRNLPPGSAALPEDQCAGNRTARNETPTSNQVFFSKYFKLFLVYVSICDVPLLQCRSYDLPFRHPETKMRTPLK